MTIAVQGAINSGDGMRPATEFSGYKFNSFAKIAGVVVGSNLSHGLCILNSGDTDAGIKFDKEITLATTDIGTENYKRFRFVDVGISGHGNITISLMVDDQDWRSYTKVMGKNGGLQRMRFPIGRDGQGRYWKVRLSVDSPFRLDSITAVIVTRNNGVVGY